MLYEEAKKPVSITAEETVERKKHKRFHVKYGAFTVLKCKEVTSCHGFTLIELLVVISILGILAAIAMLNSMTYIEKARIAKAITEIRILEKGIMCYEIAEGVLPDNLGDVGFGNLIDPWGKPYQYLNFEDVHGMGKLRKAPGEVPINSDFDLYSKGRDGQSQTPLTAKASRDDIVRANNGRYVGIASNYYQS